MDCFAGIPQTEASCVALGFFDGIHLAHRAVIECAFEGQGIKTVLSVGRQGRSAGRVLSEAETHRCLEDMGTELYLVPEFENIKNMSGERFVAEILRERLHAVRVACGYNYRFGEGASCGAEELVRFCGEYGIECAVVPAIKLDGEPISSTAVRAALTDGDMTKVERMLGRRYGYTLPVIDGQHLGRRLGTPTINQRIPDGLTVPCHGVYASVTRTGGRWYSSVTNVGMRPTVGSEYPISETWLHGFSGDLYGRQIHVELVEFIRPEQKFDSLELLRAQIRSDGEAAVKITAGLVKELNGEQTDING